MTRVANARLAMMTAAIALAAAPAAADEALAGRFDALQRNLDLAWIVLAAALVLLMQVGFMLLEAGMVRSKNAINVAQKNLLDFTFSVVVFAGVGFMIAFGSSTMFAIGFDPAMIFVGDLDAWGLAFFVFQAMFCGTAATIVSGAVAERMRLTAYVLCSVFIAGLVYPVFVHWAWGNALADNSGAFLAQMGFVDFAGSTVVHATGAWMALAACVVLGPRLGRFDAEGRPRRFAGHSPVLATSGAILLFVGWIGFNGGSTLSASPDIAHIIANTVLAAASGTVAGYFAGWSGHRVLRPEKAFSGMLGGLVAVTAGCMALTSWGAIAIGLAGGAAAVFGIALLERRFRIDDAVGAIGVHGIAGVVGTVGLALLAPVEALPLASRLDQAAVQLFGAALNFVWAFGLGLVFFVGLSRTISIRVDAGGEERGLNEAEHGTRLGTGHVEDAIDRLIEGKADLALRLPVTPGDDAERMTVLFNTFLDSIENEEIARGQAKEIRRNEEEAERLNALANATFDAILVSAGGRIVDGNAALETLLGKPLDDLKGRSVREFVAASERPSLAEHLDGRATGPFELSVLGGKGTDIPVEMRTREITYRGRKTQVSALVDLRARKDAENKIRYLAQHDPLTGLPNRAVFGDRLSRIVGRSRDDEIGAALLLVDLDHFKDINDLYGHPAGDRVIAETAERLRQAVRGIDTVARMGGDEFAIVLPHVQFANQAADLAHRLVDVLSKPIDCGKGLEVHTAASIGIALAPDHGTDPDALVSRADTALYVAKSRGRNTYCVFEPGMDADVRRRQELEADLVRAVDRGEFELHLQPRLDVRSRAIGGYEALIRWHHPHKGLVSPADFVPVAKQSGRIVAIGEWVLNEACRLAAAGLDGRRVSVNASPLQFRDRRFVEIVAGALDEHGLDPARLEIEITENVLFHDDRHAQRVLKDLKALGVRIALDDFGTGYSSLGYLSRFPFDTIKIDRSFVKAIRDTDNALAIVQTIVRLGRALGMTIVAEGVEKQEELIILASEGCDQVQGYLIGRPAPVGSLQREVAETVDAALRAARSDDSAGHAADLRTAAKRLAAGDRSVPARRRSTA